MISVDFGAGARASQERTEGPYLEGQTRPSLLLSANGNGRVNIYPENQPFSTEAVSTSIVQITSDTELDARGGSLSVPEVKKIAVLRSNGIGDFIFALPALDALRLVYPDAEIVLLGLDWHEAFLAGRPGPIDRVEVVPNLPGISYPETAPYEPDEQAIDDFFRRMQDEHFDLALQMHGGGRNSNPFIKKLAPRLSVGLRTPDAEELDRWVPYKYFQHEVMRYLEVVSLVGAPALSYEPRVIVIDADLRDSFQVIPETGKPLAILHPGAGDPRRRWPVEKFITVGNTLAWTGAQVVVVGAESDRPLAEALVAGMSSEAINACGLTSLNGLTGLLYRSSVVVSNDSGPLHLAAAVGASTVGIYWCGNLITAGPFTRTRHRPAISWRLECPVCGLNCTRATCNHPASFVADVSQEEVIGSALELLQMAQAESERVAQVSS